MKKRLKKLYLLLIDLINKVIAVIAANVYQIFGVWGITLVYRAYIFLVTEDYRYGSNRDNILYPAITVCCFILYKYLCATILKDIKLFTKINEYLDLILLTLNLSWMYFIATLDIYTILMLQIAFTVVIVLSKLAQLNSLQKVKKLFFPLALLAVYLVLIFHNTPQLTGNLSFHNKRYEPDRYSEIHSYNSAVFYTRQPSRILEYYLLPVHKYPGNPIPPEDYADYEYFVYFNYPNGADTLMTIGVALFGEDPVWPFEKQMVIPFAFYLIAFYFLIKSFEKVGASKLLSLFLAFFLYMLPAIESMKLSLYNYSYNFSFLFIAMYLLISYRLNKKRKFLIAWLIMTFIQVWFSFDMLPLMALLSLGISLYPLGEESKNSIDFKLTIESFKEFTLTITVMMFGLITRILHNALYLKSIREALHKMYERAAVRMTLVFEAKALDDRNYYLANLFRFFNQYNFQMDIFGLPLYFIALATQLFTIILSLISKKADKNYFNKIGLANLVIILSGIVWIYLMRNHAYIHAIWLARNQITILLGTIFSLILINNRLKIFKLN
jgi:hypothetical protein